MMTTDYPRLPLLFAYLIDFVRRSFGWETKPTTNICEAFHTIFWGLFPVPSALVARLLRFVFGHGRNEAIYRALSSKKADKIGKVLFLSLLAVILIAGLFGVYLYILEHGWWMFFIMALGIIGITVGVLVFIVGAVLGVAFLVERMERREESKMKMTGRVSVRKEGFRTVAIVWHFIVAVKRRLCPIWANPLYSERESAED